MKVGPLDLPVNGASQVIGFAVLLVAVIAILRMVPLPAAAAKYRP
jgi:hypothetical protein